MEYVEVMGAIADSRFIVVYAVPSCDACMRTACLVLSRTRCWRGRIDADLFSAVAEIEGAPRDVPSQIDLMGHVFNFN